MTDAARRRRAGRLSRSAEFDRVYRHGRSQANRYLVLYSFPRVEGDPSRMGLSVSRKVGGAVDRSRLKRLLREAYASLPGDAVQGHDIVIVARADLREMAERDGLDGVRSALTELLAKSGLLGAAS